ncbi:hypothetical protein ACEWY4_002387 [Coilia grayii]|uniref:Methyltransferase-like protein 22 n=1 Tax=Coilia grayii TaxID=363190 RepID=A0ABD1KNR0_9TELE
MDNVTFRMDTVLSDVHLLLPNARHLMARLNAASQPVFVSKFKILWDVEEKEPACTVPCPGGGEDDASAPRLCEGGEEDARAPRLCEGGKEDASPSRLCEGGEEDARAPRLCEGAEEDASPSRLSHTPLDDDGDLDVARRRPGDASSGWRRERVCPLILTQASGDAEDGCGEEDDGNEEDAPRQDIIRIEHTMATPLEDVGKQIWRGAFLLADFILSRPAEFAGATVLELGAGTGFTSVVMATQAKTVYCTDVGQDLLNMCQRNITINQHLTEAKASEVRVRQLDWMGNDFCTDAEEPFAWTEEEVAHLHDETSLIIAADVCYDDKLTDALFRTLYRITSNLRKPSTLYLSIEKRLNFTLRHMEVTCEAYDHFRHCLQELGDMEDGRMQYRVERVLGPVPQFFQYERVEQLVRGPFPVSV